MNPRNWERLLLATLTRARAHLPGPGVTEETLDQIPVEKRSAAALGMDIDQIMELAEERGSL